MQHTKLIIYIQKYIYIKKKINLHLKNLDSRKIKGGKFANGKKIIYRLNG